MKRTLKTIQLFAALLVLALVAFTRPAQAQDQPSQEVLMNYSLFWENFKNKDYEAARPYLGWLLENAPTFREDKNWERGVELYEELAGKAEDPAVRKTLLDSALVLIDTVVPTFKEAGAKVDEYAWTLRRGRFLHSYPEDYADRQTEVFDAYLKAFEMDPQRTDVYYPQYIVSIYVMNDQKDEAVKFMDRVEPMYKDNAEFVAYLNQTRDNLFKSPEERMAFLEEQIKAKPDNMEMMTELFDIYRKLGHTDKMKAMGQDLVKMEPNATIYRLIGDLEHQEGRSAEAAKYYTQALEIAQDDRTKRDLYYNLGTIQLEAGRLANARTYAKNALALDPNFGQAYILIGDAIVTAVQNAGSFEREDRAVYWLALDYFQKAKSADPKVAGTANARIGTYSKYTPKQEDLFFKNWQKGQSYAINYGPYSWINESTTIR